VGIAQNISESPPNMDCWIMLSDSSDVKWAILIHSTVKFGWGAKLPQRWSKTWRHSWEVGRILTCTGPACRETQGEPEVPKPSRGTLPQGALFRVLHLQVCAALLAGSRMGGSSFCFGMLWQNWESLRNLKISKQLQSLHLALLQKTCNSWGIYDVIRTRLGWRFNTYYHVQARAWDDFPYD
jgi:hypothetical protein